MARLIRLVVGVLAVVGLMAVAGGVWLMSTGIDARPQPGAVETAVARRLRSFAIPREIARRTNPVPRSEQAVNEGMEHFADHCATCHANDGSGQTEMGRGLYPKAPDMRRDETQRLSDGELFYIIEHSVKLTGMPAWGHGTADGEADSWKLVHFIRHLPRITDAELERMSGLNPRTADEWREEQESERFLQGGDTPTPPQEHEHSHGGRP